MILLHPIKGICECDLTVTDDKDERHLIKNGLLFDVSVVPSKTLQPTKGVSDWFYPFEIKVTVKAAWPNIPSDLKTYVSSFNYECDLLKDTVLWLTDKDYTNAVQYSHSFIKDTVVYEYRKYFDFVENTAVES